MKTPSLRVFLTGLDGVKGIFTLFTKKNNFSVVPRVFGVAELTNAFLLFKDSNQIIDLKASAIFQIAPNKQATTDPEVTSCLVTSESSERHCKKILLLNVECNTSVKPLEIKLNICTLITSSLLLLKITNIVTVQIIIDQIIYQN